MGINRLSNIVRLFQKSETRINTTWWRKKCCSVRRELWINSRSASRIERNIFYWCILGWEIPWKIAISMYDLATSIWTNAHIIKTDISCTLLKQLFQSHCHNQNNIPSNPSQTATGNQPAANETIYRINHFKHQKVFISSHAQNQNRTIQKRDRSTLTCDNRCKEGLTGGNHQQNDRKEE